MLECYANLNPGCFLEKSCDLISPLTFLPSIRDLQCAGKRHFPCRVSDSYKLTTFACHGSVPASTTQSGWGSDLFPCSGKMHQIYERPFPIYLEFFTLDFVSVNGRMGR